MSQSPMGRQSGQPILPAVNLENQTTYYNLPPLGSNRPAANYQAPHLYDNKNGAQQYNNTIKPITNGLGNRAGVPSAAMVSPQSSMPVRRLNIEDALTYLDQVKSCYQNNSEVYNKFLDIMKDFNTQKIDTPGVIERVYTLFGNKSALIQGFNTFLPPDYSLTYSQDPNDPAPIKITTPSGTISRAISGNVTTSPAPNVASGVNSAGLGNQYQEASEHIEMDDAINYVNKIKIRFNKQPHIYNRFIEILQTFQREQKPIQEVYQQISVLFKDAPDLLGDFQKFLPDVDSYNTSYNEQAPVQQSGVYDYPTRSVELPPIGNFNANTKSDEAIEKPDERVIEEPKEVSPYAYEIAFFNKVKEHVGDKTAYGNFLKLINLFSNEVIDKATLLARAQTYIGSNEELYEWLWKFVGFEAAEIENEEAQRQHFEYNLLESCGPSYRQLPKSETYDKCSGRDEMCWSVLNDEWVAHPTWASEDSGFVAHKKNEYEEVLFKIEEERHEYDYYLESNLRTIQALETIAKQILAMTPEEKENFSLKDGLHTSSQTIYQKVIRKVYGDEAGMKVIDAMKNSPVSAIPIVLRRLKLKDEEWRRAHREWSKVWREQESKVYLKSLDHLGLNFATNDKKYLNAKHLVTEINGLKLEELHKKLARSKTLKEPSCLFLSHQVEYELKDKDIYVDIIRLLTNMLKSFTSYTKEEVIDYANFLVLIFKTFFSLDSASYAKLSERVIALFKPEKESEKEKSKSKKEDTKKTKKNGKDDKDSNGKKSLDEKEGAESDDFEKVVEVQEEELEFADSFSDFHQKSHKKQKVNEEEVKPAEISEFAKVVNESKWQGIGLNSSTFISLDTQVEDVHFFANTDVYFFFRLVCVLYQRLAEVKSMSGIVLEKIKSEEPAFVKSLGLIPQSVTQFQSYYKDENVYEQTIKLVSSYLSGTLDRNSFEETLRQAYWNKAYKLFSIKKVLMDLLHYMKKLMTPESVNNKLLHLFESQMGKTKWSDKIEYQKAVRTLIGSENMFRVSHDKKDEKALIFFVGFDDLKLSKKDFELSDWQTYLSNYLTLLTEQSSVDDVEPYIKIASDADKQILQTGHEKLKCSSVSDGYKLYYSAN